MKYKVGDKVRVRTDIVEYSEYGGELFLGGMKSFVGKVVTINRLINDKYIIREDNGYKWTDEMFEGLANATPSITKRINDKNNVLNGMANSDAIKPDYYQFHGYDVFDIAEHFGLDFPLGNALKYLLRAGKKDKAKEVEDLRKSIVCIRKAISLKERRNDTSNWRDDNAD